MVTRLVELVGGERQMSNMYRSALSENIAVQFELRQGRGDGRFYCGRVVWKRTLEVDIWS